MTSETSLTIFLGKDIAPDVVKMGASSYFLDQVEFAEWPAIDSHEFTYDDVLRALASVRGEFVAFCDDPQPATDGLLQSAKFAHENECDVARGLALTETVTGNVGVRGLDLLANSSRKGNLSDRPEYLLDLRLTNLIIRKALLWDVCSHNGRNGVALTAPSLAARVILSARTLARVPFIVACGQSLPNKSSNGAFSASTPTDFLEVSTSLCSMLARVGLIVDETPTSNNSTNQARSSREPISIADWLSRLPEDFESALGTNEKFLILSAFPDELYQPNERSALTDTQTIALRLVRRLMESHVECQMWLNVALSYLNDLDIADAWRFDPMDGAILSCLRNGQVELGAKSARGEINGAMLGLLDSQLLETAFIALYRQYHLINFGASSSARPAIWYKRIESAERKLERQSRASLRLERQLSDAVTAKLKFEKRLRVTRRQNAQLTAAIARLDASSTEATRKKLMAARRQNKLLHDARSRLDARAADSAARFAEVVNKLTAARKQNRRLQGAISKLETKAAESAAQFTNITKKLSSARRQNARLNASATKVEARAIAFGTLCPDVDAQLAKFGEQNRSRGSAVKQLRPKLELAGRKFSTIQLVLRFFRRGARRV
jgi:hypothetical protein